MNDIEDLLRTAEPAEPSARLDGRIEGLFHAHTRGRGSLRIPLWAAAAACLVSALVGWSMRPTPAAAPGPARPDFAPGGTVNRATPAPPAPRRRDPFAMPATDVRAFLIASGGTH